jgi:hypothetical protein
MSFVAPIRLDSRVMEQDKEMESREPLLGLRMAQMIEREDA